MLGLVHIECTLRERAGTSCGQRHENVFLILVTVEGCAYSKKATIEALLLTVTCPRLNNGLASKPAERVDLDPY